jgi:hypothetical protein
LWLLLSWRLEWGEEGLLLCVLLLLAISGSVLWSNLLEEFAL